MVFRNGGDAGGEPGPRARSCAYGAGSGARGASTQRGGRAHRLVVAAVNVTGAQNVTPRFRSELGRYLETTSILGSLEPWRAVGVICPFLPGAGLIVACGAAHAWKVCFGHAFETDSRFYRGSSHVFAVALP